MKKISLKNGLEATIGLDNLCESLKNISINDKIYLIDYILSYYGNSHESPLKCLAKFKAKQTEENSVRLKESAFTPILIPEGKECYEPYLELSKKYKKESEIWKQFIDL